MGFLTAFGGGYSREPVGAASRIAVQVGSQQNRLGGNILSRATPALLAAARRNDGALLRGRSNADLQQQFGRSGALDYNNVARLGNVASIQNRFNNTAAAASRQGTAKGLNGQDQRVGSVAKVYGQQMRAAGQVNRALIPTQDALIAQQTAYAQQEKNALIQLGVDTGLNYKQQYLLEKNKSRLAGNDKAYNDYRAVNGGDSSLDRTAWNEAYGTQVSFLDRVLGGF